MPPLALLARRITSVDPFFHDFLVRFISRYAALNKIVSNRIIKFRFAYSAKYFRYALTFGGLCFLTNFINPLYPFAQSASGMLWPTVLGPCLSLPCGTGKSGMMAPSIKLDSDWKAF